MSLVLTNPMARLQRLFNTCEKTRGWQPELVVENEHFVMKLGSSVRVLSVHCGTWDAFLEECERALLDQLERLTEEPELQVKNWSSRLQVQKGKLAQAKEMLSVNL